MIGAYSYGFCVKGIISILITFYMIGIYKEYHVFEGINTGILGPVERTGLHNLAIDDNEFVMQCTFSLAACAYFEVRSTLIEITCRVGGLGNFLVHHETYLYTTFVGADKCVSKYIGGE